MKFYVDVNEMILAVTSVVKALPVRSSMPILEGIHMEARGNSLHLLCSDLMLQKECTIDANVVSEGCCVVKGKFFLELLRKLPQEEVEFDLEGLFLKVKCGRVRQRVQCIEFDEFPRMQVKGESFSLKMSNQDCHDMIERTVFAVSNDDSRPVLTGAYLEQTEDTLSIVATDPFQLAMTKLHSDNMVSQKGTIIQGKVLSEIGKMAEEGTDGVTLEITPTHITMEINRSKLSARVLDGNYIDYSRIMPKEVGTRVLVETQALYEIIDRAQLISREGNNSIQMHFANQQMVLSAESYLGRTEDELEVLIVGDDLDIAFNPKYWLNILKNISDEKVYLEFNTPISPCTIRPVQGDAFLYLIVPMRIF